MIIQAELKCKQTGCEADPCAVDKVIELPSPRFQQFSRALLADYDFIAENKNAVRHDEAARHCLLILDAEGTDGFLVDPQGHNYARYSAFVPNARSLLTPDMGIDRSYLSPAEPWRDESRDEMLRMTLRVNGKPDYTLVLPADEEYLDAVKAYLDRGVSLSPSLSGVRQNMAQQPRPFFQGRHGAGDRGDARGVPDALRAGTGGCPGKSRGGGLRDLQPMPCLRQAGVQPLLPDLRGSGSMRCLRESIAGARRYRGRRNFLPTGVSCRISRKNFNRRR